MIDQLTNFEQYLIAQQITPTAYVKYMRIYFKYLELNKIDISSGYLLDIVVKFLNLKTWKPATRNLFLFSGRQYYHKYLTSAEETSGFLKLKPTYIESKIPDFLDEEDKNNAIKYLITYHSGLMTILKLKAILDFMFYSGVRPGELLKLKREDIDFNQDPIRIKIRTPVKRRKERYTFFPQDYKNELIKYFDSEKEKINAFNITSSQLRFLMKTMGMCLKRRIYSHLFRHSAARYWDSIGISLQLIQQALGHASLKTTTIYTRPNEKMVQAGFKKAFDNRQ